jgi:hypothetical protein
MSENIELKEGFTIVCVWPATIISSEEVPEFEKFFQDEMGVRVQYLESIKTNPDLVEGCSVNGTGGREDILFGVHGEDIGKFAIPRLQFGIRWLEDVYFNDQGYLYPVRIKQYCK